MAESLWLLAVSGFAVGLVVGGLAGAGLAWWLLRRSRPAARASADAPLTPQESELSQLASASRQLMAELETRYQGRTASDEGPKRTPAKRRRKSP
jgi:hypothetical protein